MDSYEGAIGVITIIVSSAAHAYSESQKSKQHKKTTQTLLNMPWYIYNHLPSSSSSTIQSRSSVQMMCAPKIPN